MSDKVTLLDENNMTPDQLLDEAKSKGWSRVVVIGFDENMVYQRISSGMTNENFQWLLARAHYRHMEDVND